MADTKHLERLPSELLEKIIDNLPGPDILRLTQVTSGFRDFVRRSPRIQHKLDLYAAGLEPNRATGVTVADSIRAFADYRSRWKDFNINEYQTMEGMSDIDREATAGGVYGVANEHEIQFLTLPSNPRAIQLTEQRISLDFEVVGFAFHPHADVVVVTEHVDRITKYHLMTMSEGLPHPSAHKKIIECVTGAINPMLYGTLSVTGHRLASFVNNRGLDTFQLNVWDWRTGEQLFERHSSHHQLLGFLDDYRLAIKMSPTKDDATLRLLLLDIEQASSGTPVQTWFDGPVGHPNWSWIIEANGYKPSPQDILTAPFYPEPSQRILAFYPEPKGTILAMKVETLLWLAKEKAGGEVRWQEWEPYLFDTLVESRLYRSHFVRSWVSGFRLFHLSITWGNNVCDFRVYDFSTHGRMNSLRQPAGDGPRVVQPSARRSHLPWKAINICNISFGHDSMVFRVHLDIHGNELVTKLCMQRI